MKRSKARRVTAAAGIALALLAHGQGQNMFQSDGAGNQYLLNPAPPLFPFAPRSVHIGTLPVGGFATLRVRGDQLPVDDQFFPAYKATFRTDVGANINQTWDMVRGQLFMGRLYNTSDFNGFHLQAMQPDGSAWIENSADDGFQLFFNGLTTLNTFPCNRIGFAALGQKNAMVQVLLPNGPWSRFHLVHEEQGANPAYFAYRLWQRNGITFTGWSDFGFFGQKYAMGASGDGPEEDDNTDLVIAVGDEGLPEQDASTHNNISFRFLGANGVDGSAGTIEGLEMLRLRPYRASANDPITSYAGFGDFVNSGVLPQASVDVLNGQVRIQDLPTDPVSTSDELVTVNMTTGNLEHRPANALPDNCEWTMNVGSPNHVYTAFGPANGSCPDEVENVGIGDATPTAKLDVFDKTPDGSNSMVGIRSTVQGGSASSTGLDILAETGSGALSNTRIGANIFSRDADYLNYGVYSIARLTMTQSGTSGQRGNRGVAATASLINGHTYNNFGVEGQAAINTGSTTFNIGVRGYAVATGQPGVFRNAGVYGTGLNANTNYGGYFEAGSSNTTNYGIFASASNAAVNWAAWFAGNTWCTLLYLGSDASLKTNIAPLVEPLQTILQVQTHTYDFLTNDFPSLGLPSGTQVGVVAQELETVLPDLVTDAHVPAELDSLGNEVTQALDIKGVNYIGLIPYLIGAVQELKAEKDALQDEVTAMQQDLAACCSNDGTGDQRSMGAPGAQQAIQHTELFIIPNPVADLTQLRYTIATPGRTRLEVADGQGKRIEVLEEAVREVGTFEYGWNTQDLAPGTYHCTLFLNDTFVVKKAVKVAR